MAFSPQTTRKVINYHQFFRSEVKDTSIPRILLDLLKSDVFGVISSVNLVCKKHFMVYSGGSTIVSGPFNHHAPSPKIVKKVTNNHQPFRYEINDASLWCVWCNSDIDLLFTKHFMVANNGSIIELDLICTVLIDLICMLLIYLICVVQIRCLVKCFNKIMYIFNLWIQ